MNTRSRWLNILIILLVIIAALFLAQLVWQFLSGFADVILLFALAWLVSFMLNPTIKFLHDKPLPQFLVRGIRVLFGAKAGTGADAFRFSRAAAVEITYVGIALFFVVIIALLIRPVADEVRALIDQSPELVKRVPELSTAIEDQLARFGINLGVESLIQPALNSVQGLATPLLQNILTVAGGLVNVIGNLLFVLTLSFFFALDRSKIASGITRFVPKNFADEFEYFTDSVDRTFGGFIRAQLIQGLLMGAGTALAMAILGVEFSLVAGIFSGLFMLIPLLGPFLALLPPLVVALLIGAPNALILLVILIILVFLILNVIVPKMLAEALGLHPLIVFASLLVGTKVAGFWGALFAVPVAGVIVAMSIYSFERWNLRRALDTPNPPALVNGASKTQGDANRTPSVLERK